MVACTLLVSAPPTPKARPGASAKPKAADPSVKIADLVKADPIPEGYTVQSVELKDGDKKLGHMIVVGKEGTLSKVVIKIEARQIASREAKVTATKAYVNGFVQSMTEAGMTLTTRTVPRDLSKVNVDRRQRYILSFMTPDKKNLVTQIQIFFAKSGYLIQVIGEGKEFKTLTQWAKSVMPVP
jgi:hypothetical protein